MLQDSNGDHVGICLWGHQADSQPVRIEVTPEGAQLLALARRAVAAGGLVHVLTHVYPVSDTVALHPLLLITGYLDPQPTIPIYLNTVAFPMRAPERRRYLDLSLEAGAVYEAQRGARSRDYRKWPNWRERPYQALLEEPDWYIQIRRRNLDSSQLIAAHDCFPAFALRRDGTWRLVASRERFGHATPTRESLLLVPPNLQPTADLAWQSRTAFLLVDLQWNPAPTVVGEATRLIACRGNVPCLVVANDPAVLRAIGSAGLPAIADEIHVSYKGRVVAPLPPRPPVAVRIPTYAASVGRAPSEGSGRRLWERLSALPSPSCRPVRLLKATYWEIATCPVPLSAYVEHCLALRGYPTPQDRLSEVISLLATLPPEDRECCARAVSAVQELLARAGELGSRWQRTLAIAEQAAYDSCGRHTTFLCRNGIQARALEDELACALRCTSADLESIGLRMQGWRRSAGLEPETDQVVMTCWLGTGAHNTALQAQPEAVKLVLDEIEAQAALRELEYTMEALGASWSATDCLRRLIAAINDALPDDSDHASVPDMTELPHMVFMDTDVSTDAGQASGDPVECIPARVEDDLLVFIPTDRRIDIVDEGTDSISTIEPTELAPGMRIVLVDREEQRTLSAFLRHELSQNLIEEQWRTLVSTYHEEIRRALAETRLSPRQVCEGLALHGVKRNQSTIRGWLSGVHFDPLSNVHYAPGSRRDYDALCEVLGILPNAQQRSIVYQCAVMLRRANRTRGQKFGRLLRSAIQGQVDRDELTEFADQHGIDVEEMLETMRVHTVRSTHGHMTVPIGATLRALEAGRWL